MKRLIGIASALALCMSQPAGAETYPSRHITVVVPYAPGGLGDLSIRRIEQGVTRELKQPIVVDYKPGGGGAVGANFAKTLPADGYSLFIANATIMAINPTLMGKVTYDPVKDFAPVTMLVSTSHVLVVPASSPVKSFADLLDLIKQGKHLTFASSGVGGGGHLLGEMLKQKTGGALTHVPYKGAAPAMQDVLGGRIDFYFESVALAAPHVASGGIRALAVTSRQRLKAYPDMPTMTELGYPDLQADSWFGLFAPKNVPPQIAETLNAAFGKALKEPAAVKAFDDLGLDVLPGSPRELADTLRTDLARYRELITQVGMKAEQ